jgi:acetoin utilization deacetylase AcuC-like enzyme/GNAT superfamily N-acetyltransferase
MFRIRRIADDWTPANAAAIAQAEAILRQQFPGARPGEFDFGQRLRSGAGDRIQPILFVAEKADDQVQGAALVLHAPELSLVFLDYLASQPGRRGRGIGGALYQRLREFALDVGALGIFLESLPDDPALCRDPDKRRQNADRLRFYEGFGARPIVGTDYERPWAEGLDNWPYLVFDGLGRTGAPGRAQTHAVVRTILEHKYGHQAPPGYIERVVLSFRDDPVRLRSLSRRLAGPEPPGRIDRTQGGRIPLVINDKHEIHHVRDRGYVEAPVRISSILKELEGAAPFARMQPRAFSEDHIRAVHDGDFVKFLKTACALVPSEKSIYPYVFPIRNNKRRPKSVPLRAGYYCIDTFTPLNANAWLAARRAVDCALTAAEQVLEGARLAYALVRPPGHHAERRAFGGFCYLNNAAIAAHYLSRYGRVAVLDIDYHHGNGTQEIFWRRSDVLTVSIHGHPSFAFPYFSGFRDEEGEGPGKGFNLNIPLPEETPPEAFRKALSNALHRVRSFSAAFVVLSMGYDTAAGDPTGSWHNRPQDFRRIGEAVGALPPPILVVQEGGYRTGTLGANARHFFEGLWASKRPSP